ncbi:MAG: phage holin family protein [Candidatus Aquicultor sp.]
MARAVPIPPEEQRPTEERSIPGLMREIVQDSSELIQREFQLLREELSITFRETGIASAKLAAGAVFAILALGFLGFSLIVLLSALITPWISAALVGLVFLLVGGILVYSAIRNFETLSVAPNTVETLKEDAEWLRHPNKLEEK